MGPLSGLSKIGGSKVSVRCFLIGMIVLFTVGILISPGYTKIKPEIIVGMWRFDEGGGDIAKDSSGKGNDGKFVNNPKRVAGKFGTALEVNGTNGVQVPHTDSLSLSTFTIAAWIKLDKGGSWQQVVVKPERNYSVGVSPANLVECAFTVGGNYRTALGKTPVTDGQWHHVTGTYDKTFIRVYVDGVLEAENSCVEQPALTTQAVIIAGPGEAIVEGIVDEVYIFNTALKIDEIEEVIQGMDKAVEPAGKLSAAWGRVKTAY